MSPTMRAVPRIDPSSRREGFATEGGPTSATGSPNRVTSTGFPVFRTRSKTARQVALNFEMAIWSIRKVYHGQRSWSTVTAQFHCCREIIEKKVRGLSHPGACI